MSGFGWAVRRLGAMSPAEISHRLQVSLRDRLAPPAYARRSASEAATSLYTTGPSGTLERSRLARLVHVPRRAEDFAPELAEAERLVRGEWTLFGRPVRLASPPEWRRNPITGETWPDAPARTLDFHRTDLAGGAKYTWELGRLTALPTLALAGRLGDARAREQALAWIEDFAARNPLGHGIHHTSGIEMAIRVLTLTWTLALLDDAPPARVAPALGLIAQQTRWCRDHQSLGSSANNHLIAELAAMATAGAVFPTLQGGEALARDAFEGLNREIVRQIHPDGATAEQAFGYLPFVWELLLYPLIACAGMGREIPDVVRERLVASLEFARVVRLPGGRLPQIGDEDDGRILLAGEGESRLDLVGDALATWLGAGALSEGGSGALARLLFGRVAPSRTADDGRHEFREGGYTVWRERGVLVTFDHGPLGLGALAAHGHADALAVTIFRGADPLVVDPGTFAYHEDAPARDWFRGTPAHSTVHFGGRSQSERLGPFLWGARASVAPTGAGFECRWASGERHARSVAVSEGRITIADQVQGEGAEIAFALAPGATVTLDGTRATVRSGGSLATFASEGLAPWQREDAEHSPRYGWKEPASRLVAKFLGDRAKTTITLGDAANT